MRDLIDITKSLYESDEYQWMLDQIEALQEKKYESVDYGNLLQYLSEMDGRDRRELASRLVVLTSHMLKFLLQPEHASRIWVSTILTQQGEISNMFEESPTLKNYAPTLLPKIHLRAVKLASRETYIPTMK